MLMTVEKRPAYNGIINVYKEAGHTSFDVVAKLRGILKQKKIGHTGTLDPDATGVLPVVVGNATKLADYLTDKKKEYIAAYVLGIRTDTGDVSGNALPDGRQRITAGENSATEEAIRQATAAFTGDIMQIPPMYSAVRVDGRKLYELAREGREIERRPRPVTVYETEILHIGKAADFCRVFDRYYGEYDCMIPGYEAYMDDRTLVCMRVVCSKGTYIRTLCEDIGSRLGPGAAMAALKRTMSGAYSIDTALTLSQIEARNSEAELDPVIQPVDTVFKEHPAVTLTGDKLRLARNGNKLKLDVHRMNVAYLGSDKLIRVYDDRGQFFALYEQTEQRNVYKARTVFL